MPSLAEDKPNIFTLTTELSSERMGGEEGGGVQLIETDYTINWNRLKDI